MDTCRLTEAGEAAWKAASARSAAQSIETVHEFFLLHKYFFLQAAQGSLRYAFSYLEQIRLLRLSQRLSCRVSVFSFSYLTAWRPRLSLVWCPVSVLAAMLFNASLKLLGICVQSSYLVALFLPDHKV